MKLYFVSLGCDKNLVDSEKMLALLVRHNIEITDVAEEAEIILVNTCGFIQDAKEESIETILTMAEMKKEGQCRIRSVSGQFLCQKWKRMPLPLKRNCYNSTYVGLGQR